MKMNEDMKERPPQKQMSFQWNVPVYKKISTNSTAASEATRDMIISSRKITLVLTYFDMNLAVYLFNLWNSFIRYTSI